MKPPIRLVAGDLRNFRPTELSAVSSLVAAFQSRRSSGWCRLRRVMRMRNGRQLFKTRRQMNARSSGLTSILRRSTSLSRLASPPTAQSRRRYSAPRGTPGTTIAAEKRNTPTFTRSEQHVNVYSPGRTVLPAWEQRVKFLPFAIVVKHWVPAPIYFSSCFRKARARPARYLSPFARAVYHQRRSAVGERQDDPSRASACSTR
jgi:hypothetical protein